MVNQSLASLRFAKTFLFVLHLHGECAYPTLLDTNDVGRLA